jgi:hypothetical protein
MTDIETEAALRRAQPPQPSGEVATAQDFGTIAAALGMLSSAIKGGEAWSDACEEIKTRAFDALARIGSCAESANSRLAASVPIAVLDDTRKQFQQETQRTSEYYRLTERIMVKLRDMGHRADALPPCQHCDICKWLIDAKELMARPINVSSAALSTGAGEEKNGR